MRLFDFLQVQLHYFGKHDEVACITEIKLIVTLSNQYTHTHTQNLEEWLHFKCYSPCTEYFYISILSYPTSSNLHKILSNPIVSYLRFTYNSRIQYTMLTNDDIICIFSHLCNKERVYTNSLFWIFFAGYDRITRQFILSYILYQASYIQHTASYPIPPWGPGG